MLFSVLRALDGSLEEMQASEQYEDESKVYGTAKANKLKRDRFFTRRAENKRKARKAATLGTAILSPIPLVWLLLSAAGGGFILGLIEGMLIALTLWSVLYAGERIKCCNPYK